MLKWILPVLIALGSYACKSDDGGGDSGGNDSIPKGKKGTLTADLANDFVDGTSGGLTSVEKMTSATNDSSTAVNQMKSMSHASTGLTLKGDDADCKPTTEGEKTDGDSDGFYKDYSAVFDCEYKSEENSTYTLTQTGTFTSTDADDADASSAGTYGFKDFKYTSKSETKAAGKTYSTSFTYNTDGHITIDVDDKTKTAEVAFLSTYSFDISGLPEGTKTGTEDVVPSFFYNMTTSHNTEDKTLEIKGFYRAKGAKASEDGKSTEKYDYALEITTEEPLTFTTACNAQHTFGAGIIVYEAGSGTLKITYNSDCTRTITLNDEALD